MNIVMLLKPKETVAYIYEDSTIRQALEKMKAHSYTAVPLLTNTASMSAQSVRATFYGT